MLQHLRIENVGPAALIDTDFASRITLLTGDNGLGKSFLLEVAWWAMTRSWAGRPATPSPRTTGDPSIGWRFQGAAKPIEGRSEFDFDAWRWPQAPGRPANPGMVIYARADGSFSVFDPARNYWRNAQSVGVVDPDRPGSFHFTASDVWDGLREESTSTFLCNGLTTDWVAWQRKNGAAWSQLTAVLAKLSEPGQSLEPGEPARLEPLDAREYPTLDLGYGVVPTELASAGMRRICALAYLLVWTWQEHLEARKLQREPAPLRDITFLIDEVEAHLHPKWQRTILRSLVDVMTALGQDDGARVQIVTATHSPLLPVSIEPVFDTAVDKIMTFDIDHEGLASLHDVVWARQGDTRGWLLSDMFDLDADRSPEAVAALSAFREVVEQDVRDLDRLGTVDADLRSYLAEHDPQLARWQAYYDRVRGEGVS